MEDKFFTVRLDPQTRAMLEMLAAWEERKRGDVVKRLIRKAARNLPAKSVKSVKEGAGVAAGG